MVATRKGLLRYQRDGNWRRTGEAAFVGDHVSYAVNDPRTGTLWAGVALGHWGCKLRRSDDHGATWAEVEPPKYPEGAMLKGDQPAALEYIWTIDPAPQDRPGRILMGTIPGGLFESNDDGASWSLVEPLWNHPSREESWFGGGFDNPGIHSILTDPRNSDHWMIAVSCAGVFLSRDAGASWEVKNNGIKSSFLPEPNPEVGHDPHLIAMCPAHPDTIWQQNHDRIYLSTDGAKEWQPLSDKGQTPNFGFAVAAHATDPKTAWVAPAVSDENRTAVDGSLAVWHTEDGGASWQDLRAGLPQEDCFDFVFRHSLDVAGDTLALGTACGSLYISEDRGDTWQTLGHHLPPIHSVRFWRG